MSSKRVQFRNTSGQLLAARLELPDNREPHNYALFAHCFTCNKNLGAVRNIARALIHEGIAVLRFDFTGLGESEGDFVDTSFSSNIEDLICAASFLEQEYVAPTLLIGHSLGGAAVLYAAGRLASVKAVATIGAPSSPTHVQHLLQSGLDEIERSGSATISIGGRPFAIKKEFLDDLQTFAQDGAIRRLHKPLAVFRSPHDTTVDIDNAKEIYDLAHHPKSFISLDGADHLLSDSKDSAYVGRVTAGWADRYLDRPEDTRVRTGRQVAVSIGNEGFTSEIVAGKHLLIADEPERVGGRDFGPSPYAYVSAGLGACTAMTLRLYATRKNWDLQKVVVHIDHGKDHCEDCENAASGTSKIDRFIKEIELHGDLDEQQKARLLEVGGNCPVHRTLLTASVIKSGLIDK